METSNRSKNAETEEQKLPYQATNSPEKTNKFRIISGGKKFRKLEFREEK